MGNTIDDTFEIKYIVEKPYNLDCDFFALKKDLEQLNVIFNVFYAYVFFCIGDFLVFRLFSVLVAVV